MEVWPNLIKVWRMLELFKGLKVWLNLANLCQTFARFGLKISTRKTEIMAFNVPEEVKAQTSLFSVGGVVLKNVCTFKYLGHVVTNNDDDPSHYLNFCISSVFKKTFLVTINSKITQGVW